MQCSIFFDPPVLFGWSPGFTVSVHTHLNRFSSTLLLREFAFRDPVNGMKNRCLIFRRVTVQDVVIVLLRIWNVYCVFYDCTELCKFIERTLIIWFKGMNIIGLKFATLECNEIKKNSFYFTFILNNIDFVCRFSRL